MGEYHYNPEEAIRIAEEVLPKLGTRPIFSSRYVLSNMRQMKEKAEILDELIKILKGHHPVMGGLDDWLDAVQVKYIWKIKEAEQ